MMKLPESTDARRSRRKTWRGRNLFRGIGVLSLMACVASGTWAVEESAKLVREGLRGIFPATPPAELGADAFARLDGNWAEWSQGAAAAVADFYAKLETTDADAQREALKVLKSKLVVMQKAIDDPRYASLFVPLVAMHGRLSQRIDFAEATLDTLEMDPEKVRAAKLVSQAKDVVTAIGDLKAYLSTVPNGSLWLPYVKADALSKALPAGAAEEATTTLATAAKGRIVGRKDLAAEDQKEFLGRPAFLRYEAALDRFLAAVARRPAATDEPELKKQLKSLSDAVDLYSITQSIQDAKKARVAYSALCKAAPDDGDRIGAVLQKHLFNYNIRIVAGEDFLNKLLSDARVENGPVVDNVLGAAVSGTQRTDTKVTVDLRPSPNTARFDLALNGAIQSSTVGVTSEATVYTQGNHTFVAKKEINFDGVQFSTAPGTIVVYPHNTTTGINTNVGGLFSGIANGIASQEVEKRRGQAEAIAASRVRERVLPKFNEEVDKKFAEAGPKLEKDVFSGLRATRLYPDAYAYQTTDSSLRLNTRLMSEGELGADTPQMAMASDRGATLLMHETAVNNSIDRMGLEGQTLTETELRAKMEEFFSKALGREVKLQAPPAPAVAEGEDNEKGPSAIMMAASDPLRVHFENGELILTIRAGFKQEGKDDIPSREITAPISFEVKDKKIIATRGNVRVIAADGEGGGIAINGVVRKKIQAVLPDREFDTKVEIKGPNKTVESHISKIRFIDGWAAISLN